MTSVVWPLEVHDTLRSTNTYILTQMRNQEWTESRWVLALEQTAGRGTHNKSWLGARGNLYLSAGFICPSAQSQRLTDFGFIAPLSIRDAISHYAPELSPALKWPNDVRINRSKISGILVETISMDSLKYIVVGLGVNLNHTPKGLDQEACHLSAFTGSDIDVIAFADEIRNRFAHYLSLSHNDFDAIQSAWNASAEDVGKPVKVETPSGKLAGLHKGIDANGALILEMVGGKQVSINSGRLAQNAV